MDFDSGLALCSNDMSVWFFLPLILLHVSSQCSFEEGLGRAKCLTLIHFQSVKQNIYRLHFPKGPVYGFFQVVSIYELLNDLFESNSEIVP